MDYYKLGRYLFVSMDEDRKVGSIYYENGRMRFVHENGPTVEVVDKRDICLRFIIPDGKEFKFSINDSCVEICNYIGSKGGKMIKSSYDKFKNILKDQAIADSIKIGTRDVPHNFEKGVCLYEVYIEYDSYNKNYFFYDDHISRGCPVILNINKEDKCYKDIYTYAYKKIYQKIDQKIGNFAVYGCFYSYYEGNLPFQMYNPYDFNS